MGAPSSLSPIVERTPISTPNSLTGVRRPLLDVETPIVSGVLSGDGEWLVYTHGTVPNISAVGRDSVHVALLATPAVEVMPQLSPDGRWLAYVSAAPGQFQVYVSPFPDVAATTYLISTDLGFAPIWAHSGRELFYVNGANQLVAVEVLPGPTFGERRPLLQLPRGSVAYAVAPDDQRFLVMHERTDEGARELIVVENFVEELKAKVGN